MNQLSNISCGGNSSELDSENIKVSGSGGLNVTNKLTPKKGKKWLFEEVYFDIVHVL